MQLDSFFIQYIFPVILGALMILWIYCIWFLNKYDKNSNRLIMLILLNIYYVPFYLFKVRKIKKELKIKAIGDEILDSDFIQLSRNSIIENLRLWESKDTFLNFQFDNDTPLKEIFQQWKSYYQIDDNILDEAFNLNEKELLKTFNKAINSSEIKIANNYPSLNSFIETNDWSVLNKLSIKINKELR